jgi:hypothetical protein
VSEADYKIEKGNIYESADPRDDGRQIRITSYYTGYAQANIVSHPSGKRHRSINVKYLHENRDTQNGQPRKNGYFFVGKHEDSADATA